VAALEELAQELFLKAVAVVALVVLGLILQLLIPTLFTQLLLVQAVLEFQQPEVYQVAILFLLPLHLQAVAVVVEVLLLLLLAALVVVEKVGIIQLEHLELQVRATLEEMELPTEEMLLEEEVAEHLLLEAMV
jgi:hypothetical protein